MDCRFSSSERAATGAAAAAKDVAGSKGAACEIIAVAGALDCRLSSSERAAASGATGAAAAANDAAG